MARRDANGNSHGSGGAGSTVARFDFPADAIQGVAQFHGPLRPIFALLLQAFSNQRIQRLRHLGKAREAVVGVHRPAGALVVHAGLRDVEVK